MKSGGLPGELFKVMQELLDHIEKVKNLKRNILDYAEQVVEENADKIEQFNLEQLNDGIDSDGQDIKPGYT
jgi:hypothetical protein